MPRLSYHVAAFAAALAPVQAWAQSAEDVPQPIEGRLILEVQEQKDVDPALLEQCEKEQDAAQLSSEIIVCRMRNDAEASGFDKERWEREYAARTQGQQPVNVDGPGINGHLSGGASMRGCIPGLQKCPPPPALIIDVAALPEAPPGSDADRIARGLPPLGDRGDAGRGEASIPIVAEAAAPGESDGALSSAGSAEPEGAQ